MRSFILCVFALCVTACRAADYTGHRVLSILPQTREHLELLHKLSRDYSVDLWNEPRILGANVMTHLKPSLQKDVESLLKQHNITYDVAFDDLQSVIEQEKIVHAPTNASLAAEFDFGKYNNLEKVINLMKGLADEYPSIAKLDTIGKSFENRPIYVLKISSGDGSSKPAIMIECGIHPREWTSVAAGAYLAHRLVTNYGSDPEITRLVDQHEFSVVLIANPDGYVYTWTQDRLWRKTRSRSSIDWMGVCRGADANRNFDIDHCGIGTSRKPCEEIFCGDKPFSESETRALRDLMISLQSRIKVYFSLHAFSQYWMTPYGIHKRLPANYNELVRIGKAGIQALSKKYGTQYSLGSIANIIYEAAGSSLDYFYDVLNVKIGFALELRDRGRFGFFLPQHLILPTCEETFDGLVGAINAI